METRPYAFYDACLPQPAPTLTREFPLHIARAGHRSYTGPHARSLQTTPISPSAGI
jgi:hypothetical protein